MKCAVLGGGGFIGSTIVDKLLLEGHSIRVFERQRIGPYRQFLPHEDVEWMTGDLLGMHDVTEALTGVDVVFHLVSTTLPKNSNDDPIYDVQTNIIATLQILDVMVSLKIPKIVFISSGGTVYGKPLTVPIDENHPTEPQVSYGVTKLAIEKYLHIYKCLYGIKPIVLRVSNPYGERQRVETAQGAVGVFLTRALAGVPINIWGDGSVIRDYVYVGDVADAFVRALEYEGDYDVFNIGSGCGTSLNELVHLIESTLCVPIKRQYLNRRLFDVPSNVLNNALAARELLWTPKMSLGDGLCRTAEWVKKTMA